LTEASAWQFLPAETTTAAHRATGAWLDNEVEKTNSVCHVLHAQPVPAPNPPGFAVGIHGRRQAGTGMLVSSITLSSKPSVHSIKPDARIVDRSVLQIHPRGSNPFAQIQRVRENADGVATDIPLVKSVLSGQFKKVLKKTLTLPSAGDRSAW